MNGLERLRALGSRLEGLAVERATVTVDGRPLWRALLDIAAQIEREHAEPGGLTLPGLKVLGLDHKELREGEEVWSTRLGRLVTISHVRPNGTVTLYNHGCTPFRSLDFTHEVPPLDADVAEIRAGDVLYSVETGESVTVESVEPGNPWFAATSGTLQHCSKFTHRAPVLAADGKPLREGETVYKVGGDGTAYVYDGMSDNVDGLAMLYHNDKPYVGTGLRADQLTHERTETRQSIADEIGEDMLKRIDAIVSAGRWS